MSESKDDIGGIIVVLVGVAFIIGVLVGWLFEHYQSPFRCTTVTYNEQPVQICGQRLRVNLVNTPVPLPTPVLPEIK